MGTSYRSLVSWFLLVFVIVSILPSSFQVEGSQEQQQVSVFRDPNYLNSAYVMNILPKVYFLPIDEKFYSRAQNNQPGNFLLSDHSQDAYFYYWLKNSYPKVVQKDEEAELFYVPTIGTVKEINNILWWRQLDEEIQGFITTKKIKTLVLDNSFIIVTFPGMTRPVQVVNYQCRNVRDLRFFRSDNDMTPNGRDIFLPYSISPLKLANYSIPRHEIVTTGRKKHSIMMIGREAAGGGENIRLWRTNLHDQLSYVQDALLAKSLTYEEFHEGLQRSTFCFIVPGDTPSTSKLYKAIFFGCIPVIFISFPSLLPFNSILDWSKFSIVVRKDIIRMPGQVDKLIARLLQIMEEPQVLTNYQIHLHQAARLFNFSVWEWPSVYHLALLELKLSMEKENKDLFPLR